MGETVSERVRRNQTMEPQNGHVSGGGSRVKLETITLESAKRDLQRSADITKANPERRNRNRSEAHILELASIMEAGAWEVNGETIKFAEDGFLEDGQHRMEAVVMADVTIQSWVVRGLPMGVFDTIDRGRTRTLSQIMERHGEKNSTSLAAALGWLDRYYTNQLRKTNRLHPTRAAKLLDKHPTLRESVKITKSHNTLVPTSVAAAAHYLFCKIDGEAADAMFEKLYSGEHLTRTNPIYLLRERMLDPRTKKLKTRSLETFALLIKTWNNIRAGHQPKALRWRVDGDNPEEFPRPL